MDRIEFLKEQIARCDRLTHSIMDVLTVDSNILPSNDAKNWQRSVIWTTIFVSIERFD